MQVKIEVKACDIRRGCKYVANNCPIARAINRKIKRKYGAYVCNTNTVISELTTGTAFADNALPLIAGKFVNAFDSGADVTPFSFYLSLPKKLVR